MNLISLYETHPFSQRASSKRQNNVSTSTKLTIYIFCRDLPGITVLLSVCTYFLTMTVSHNYKYIKGDL
jgi:hypothetical protein